MASVEELGETFRRFGVADYTVFIAMLAVCLLVGVYFGFFAGKTSTDDYLVGGRNMGTFPVSMSLISSYISGITLLGTPTEMYVYGTQYLMIIGAVLLMGVVMSHTFIPVFHNMKITSTYEYLERRFDNRVRLFGSLLFAVSLSTWLPIVVYVTALAFNQVTGVNIHVTTSCVCLVCVIYTGLGGLRAVVWTDVIQTCVMFAAMVLVVVKGTLDVGGFGVVLSRNYESGRIEPLNFSGSPFERHTVWILLVGGFSFWVQSNAVSHNQVQRYLALSRLKSAQRAVWIFVAGCVFMICVCAYAGLLIFAKYHDCDPLTTKLASAKDQLLPLLVMDTLGGYPGIPGLFVAGIFSAALSSLSTGLNSMSAVVLEDFWKPYASHAPTDRQAAFLVRGVVLALGGTCVALVFVVERLGPVLQMMMSLGGVTSGASLGIFFMGLYLPTTNARGALYGGVVGFLAVAWMCAGAELAAAQGRIVHAEMPVSVSGCTYNFTTPALVQASHDADQHKTSSEVFALYRVSYMLYTFLGAAVSTLAGLVFSYLPDKSAKRCSDPRLVSPWVRRFLPEQQAEEHALR